MAERALEIHLVHIFSRLRVQYLLRPHSQYNTEFLKKFVGSVRQNLLNYFDIHSYRPLDPSVTDGP